MDSDLVQCNANATMSVTEIYERRYVAVTVTT